MDHLWNYWKFAFVFKILIIFFSVAVTLGHMDHDQQSRAHVRGRSGGYGSADGNGYGSSYGSGGYGHGHYSHSGGGYGHMSNDDHHNRRKHSKLIIPGNPLVNVVLQVTFPFSINLGIPIGRKKRDNSEDDYFSLLDQVLHEPLQKVDAILHTLGIRDRSCFESTICLINQNFEDYHPLPILIEKLLVIDGMDDDHLPLANSSNVIRYSRYMNAQRQGQIYSSSCALPLPTCSQKVDRILHNPLFKFLRVADNFMSVNMV